MRIFFALLILVSCQAFSDEQIKESELQRLDPHGSFVIDLHGVSLGQYPVCKICHVEKEKKWELKGDIYAKCVACHNPLSHSGLVEHLDKDLSGVGLEGKVTCLSCHRPHRALLKMTLSKALTRDPFLTGFKEIEEPSFLKLKKDSVALSPGLVDKPKPDAMIERVCVDCHKFRREVK